MLNIRNHFLVYFPEHKQALENIFLFKKCFHLKIFYTQKIFYIEPNMTLINSNPLSKFISNAFVSCRGVESTSQLAKTDPIQSNPTH